MTISQIITTTPQAPTSSTAMARKRRREKLILQRYNNMHTPMSAIPSEVPSNSEMQVPQDCLECEKYCPISVTSGAQVLSDEAEPKPDYQTSTPMEVPSSADEPHSKRARKQMRYDPDVPMSREDISTWRKELRRIRNRQSAAASRQRTRDRINELESEVNEWKAKYADAMERLHQMEIQLEKLSRHTVCSDGNKDNFNGNDARCVVSPCSSPSPRSNLTPSSSPVSIPVPLPPIDEQNRNCNKYTQELVSQQGYGEDFDQDEDSELEDFLLEAFECDES